MRVLCLREDLVDGLQLSLPFTAQRGSLAILGGVFLHASENSLSLKTTDLNTFFSTSLSCDTEKEGKCVVSARVFLDILKDMEEERIVMEVAENLLSVEGISSRFHLHTMPWEDFPAEPEKGEHLVDDIPAETLAKSLEKVSRAASKDEKRPVLTGIYLEVREEGITLVSTDSYRLSLMTITGGFDVMRKGEFMIPSQISQGVNRLAQKNRTFQMYGGEAGSYLALASGENAIKVRLIEGKFPKYEQFIPKETDKEALVDRKRILSALRRVTHVGSTVKIELGEEKMRLSTISKDVGEAWEEVPVEYKGEGITIAFNGKFLEDGISSVEGERVYIGLTEPLKPAIVKEADTDDFLYLVMPVRL